MQSTSDFEDLATTPKSEHCLHNTPTLLTEAGGFSYDAAPHIKIITSFVTKRFNYKGFDCTLIQHANGFSGVGWRGNTSVQALWNYRFIFNNRDSAYSALKTAIRQFLSTQPHDVPTVPANVLDSKRPKPQSTRQQHNDTIPQGFQGPMRSDERQVCPPYSYRESQPVANVPASTPLNHSLYR